MHLYPQHIAILEAALDGATIEVSNTRRKATPDTHYVLPWPYTFLTEAGYLESIPTPHASCRRAVATDKARKNLRPFS